MVTVLSSNLNEIGKLTIDVMKTRMHGRKSLRHINRAVDELKRKNPGDPRTAEVEEQAGILKKRRHAEEMREKYKRREEEMYCDDAKYEPIIEAHRKRLLPMARIWAEHFTKGDAQKAWRDILDQDRLKVRVARTAEYGMQTTPDGDVEFLIPEHGQKGMPGASEMLKMDPATREGALDVSMILAGHHESSEMIKALSMGVTREEDIVHHTLGMAGQVIGLTANHKKAFGKDTHASLKHMYDLHEREERMGPDLLSGRGENSMSRAAALAQRTAELEQEIKKHGADDDRIRRLKAAMIEHHSIHGAEDPVEYESCRLAFGIIKRLGEMPPDKMQKAIWTMYSGGLNTRQELEDFVRGQQAKKPEQRQGKTGGRRRRRRK